MAFSANLLRLRRTGPSPEPRLAPQDRLRLYRGVMVLLAFVFVGDGMLAYQTAREKAELKRAIARLQAEGSVLRRRPVDPRADAIRRDIQRRLDIIGQLARGRGAAEATLRGVLEAAVPTGVRLTSLELGPRSEALGTRSGGGQAYAVRLAGDAGSDAQVAELAARLGRAGFADVTSTVASPRMVGAARVVPFDVAATLRR